MSCEPLGLVHRTPKRWITRTPRSDPTKKVLGVCKGARRVWLQSSDSRHRHRVVTLQHQRHDAVATTPAFSGLASAQLQLVVGHGYQCWSTTLSAEADFLGQSYSSACGLTSSIRLSKCGAAAHQRRPSSTCTRTRVMCAAKRQFAHLGPEHARGVPGPVECGPACLCGCARLCTTVDGPGPARGCHSQRGSVEEER